MFDLAFYLIEGPSAVTKKEAEMTAQSVAPHEEFQTWMCLICGWIYDEAAGYPDDGIAPGTRWADVPMNWTCPECGARKEDFEMISL